MKLGVALAWCFKAYRENDREVVNTVEIKILRRVRAESSRRPPRHRRDACSTAWRCRFLTARLRAPDALVDFHTGDACHSEALETQLRDEWRTRGVPYQAYPFAATLLRNEGHLDCGYFRHTALDLFGSSRGRAGGAAVDHAQWCGEISGRISGGAALFPPVNWTRTTRKSQARK